MLDSFNFLKISFVGHERRDFNGVVLGRGGCRMNFDFLVFIGGRTWVISGLMRVLRRHLGSFGGNKNRDRGRVYYGLGLFGLGSDIWAVAGRKCFWFIYKIFRCMSCGGAISLQMIGIGLGFVKVCWVHWKELVFI